MYRSFAWSQWSCQAQQLQLQASDSCTRSFPGKPCSKVLKPPTCSFKLSRRFPSAPLSISCSMTVLGCPTTMASNKLRSSIVTWKQVSTLDNISRANIRICSHKLGHVMAGMLCYCPLSTACQPQVVAANAHCSADADNLCLFSTSATRALCSLFSSRFVVPASFALL